MTRFNITLQEGADFVIENFSRMWGGEIFVPKIPSYRITDIAEAIAPDATQEVVGIRPGEKLHEEMITVTDSLSTIEFEKYFVIGPSFPLWDRAEFAANSSTSAGWNCQSGFTYNSGTNDHFLSVAELRDLIVSQLS